VKKGGGAGENEIDAISGATITSTAVTNVVNAATEFVEDYAEK
jgi:possible NADH dehydrogenase (ubiquinone), rnfG subunit